MGVLVACKNEEDQIKNEGLEWSVMESCRNSNPSKLLWLTLLPKRMKKIHWKMKAQSFSHYKSMGIFPNAQGQLTHKCFV